jgi:hypothetical protein
VQACGGCTACCQIVPVKELGLEQYQGCPHIHSVLHVGGPGCGIYRSRPLSCRVWRCGWLQNEDWEDDLRPDRCGFIVDEVQDVIIVNGVERPAVQIWCLPGHEDAYERQPAIAVILAILHDLDMDVLWRMPGHLAVGLHLEADGTVSRSPATPDAPETFLGGTSARIAKAEKIMQSRPKNRGQIGGKAS